MNSAWIIFALYLCYGVPSVLLYIVCFYVILRNTKLFGSSFFHLFLFDGSMNLFTYLLNYFKTRLPAITCGNCFLSGFYRNVGKYVPLDFLMTMNYHMGYVQYAMTAVIAANRLTVLLYSATSEPIWKKFSWAAVLVVFLLPFINTRVVFNYPSRIEYLNTTDTFSMTSDMPLDDVFWILVPCMVAATCISVVANVASIVFINVMTNKTVKRAEVNFITITCINCGIQVFGTCITVFRSSFAGTPLGTLLTNLLPFASDGLSLSQPWLLFAFSEVTRHKVLTVLGLKPPQQGTSLMVVRSITG